MKKSYRLNDLGCANCAAKMQDKICALDGVTSASVNFVLQKLTIECEDGRLDEVLDAAERIVSSVEPDCEIVR